MDKKSVEISTLLLGVLLSLGKTKKYNVNHLLEGMLLASEKWAVCVEKLGWVSDENIKTIKESIKETANEQTDEAIDLLKKMVKDSNNQG